MRNEKKCVGLGIRSFLSHFTENANQEHATNYNPLGHVRVVEVMDHETIYNVSV